MSIGKIIKTGLAIYGGTVLAKKIGRYLFVKNKDKIAAKIKEKIVKACDKAIDEVFKDDKKKNPYSFKAVDVSFWNAGRAYDIRQIMVDNIHEHGKVTVRDYKQLSDVRSDIPEDDDWGWTDPNDFESAPIERAIFGDGYVYDDEYVYYIDVRHPDKLGDI